MKFQSYQQFLELLKESKIKNVQFEIFDTSDPAHTLQAELKDGKTFCVLVLPSSVELICELCYQYKTHVSFEPKTTIRMLWRKLWTPISVGLIAAISSFLGFVLLIFGIIHLCAPEKTERGFSNIPPFATVIFKEDKRSEKEATNALSLDEVIIDEAMRKELLDIGDYLHHPEKFERMGVTPPKGLLLTGPPGTGKTMLARALANTISANFIAVKGSEFQKKFIGEGAKMVRDLFTYARSCSPCLIYIDEIDELGRNRNDYVFSSNYAALSLNQLLTELDGFNERQQIFVIASTNLESQVDRALLRPGRLERTLHFKLPNKKQREEILNIWVSRKKISLASPDLCAKFAKMTGGWSGAKLANLINEAAIEAAQKSRIQVNEEDFDHAYWRIELGSRQRSSWDPSMIKKIATHEAGHLLCQWALNHKYKEGYSKYRDEELHYHASILPGTSGFLGLVASNVAQDLLSFPEKNALEAGIITLLGGRESERLFYSPENIDPGASFDYLIAKNLILNYIGLGFSDNPKFYGNCIELLEENANASTLRNYSGPFQEELQLEIDSIWKKMQLECQDLLKKNVNVLKELADALFEKETLLHEDIVQFFASHPLTF